MKKLFALVLSAASLIAMAQTPEQMIQQLPSLPTAAEVISHDKAMRQRMAADNPDDTPLPLDVWGERVKAKMEQFRKTLESQTKQSVAETITAHMDSKVAGTNVTKREASQMNEAQLQALAQQAVAGQLGKVGLNISDLANISEDMSEEEQNALVDKILAAQTGGLTQKDIKAMENMTDAQRAAYMKKKGLTTTPQQLQANAAQNDANARVGMRVQTAQSELQAATQRWTEAAPLKQAVAQGEKIYQTKYAARVQAINQQFHAYVATAEEAYTAAIEAQGRQIRQQRAALEDQFFAEYIPIYRKAVAQMCDMAKNDYLAANKEYQEAFDEAYRTTGQVTFKIPSIYAFQGVEAYAEALLLMAGYALDSNRENLMKFDF